MGGARPFKRRLRDRAVRSITRTGTRRECRIVAEGDSWFAYPVHMDIVDHLIDMGYAVVRGARLGDTLANMVYGTDVTRGARTRRVHPQRRDRVPRTPGITYTNRGPRNLRETLAAVKKHQPRFVLLSAGGNDIVGEEMRFYLNHVRSGLPAVRTELADYMIGTVMRRAIENLCKEIWNVNAGVHILMDGYDYPVPTGKSFHGLTGPWVLPTLVAKGIVNPSEQTRIIKVLVDRFNRMLADVDRSRTQFHYVKLTGMFPDEGDWHNEIHLKSAGFKRVAERYHATMVAILGTNPLA
jgi:lysophospholipase L1-like esterase